MLFCEVRVSGAACSLAFTVCTVLVALLGAFRTSHRTKAREIHSAPVDMGYFISTSSTMRVWIAAQSVGAIHKEVKRTERQLRKRS
jgi:hypothetical protein